MSLARSGVGLLALLLFSTVASAGEHAAEVLLLDGESTRERSGDVVALEVGMALEPDDLVACEEGLLYLVLHNDRVVQVGEEIESLVRELATYDEGPTDEPVGEQLSRYVDPAGVPSTAWGHERIAGWSARIQTAERPREDFGRKEVAREEVRSRKAAVATSPSPAPPPPPPQADVGASSGDSSLRNGLDTETGSDGGGFDGHLPTMEPGPAGAVADLAFAEEAPDAAEAALRLLVVEAQNVCDGGTPKRVRVFVRDGVIVKVRKARCLEGALLGQPLPADGWVSIRP